MLECFLSVCLWARGVFDEVSITVWKDCSWIRANTISMFVSLIVFSDLLIFSELTNELLRLTNRSIRHCTEKALLLSQHCSASLFCHDYSLALCSALRDGMTKTVTYTLTVPGAFAKLHADTYGLSAGAFWWDWRALLSSSSPSRGPSSALCLAALRCAYQQLLAERNKAFCFSCNHQRNLLRWKLCSCPEEKGCSERKPLAGRRENKGRKR